MLHAMAASIGLRLKELRERAGVSQEALAKAAGYKRAATISQIETGGQTPTPAKLDGLVKAFHALGVKTSRRELDPNGEAFRREGRARQRPTTGTPDYLNTTIEAQPTSADNPHVPRKREEAEAATMAQSDQRLEDLRAVFKQFERLFRQLESVNGGQDDLIEALDQFRVAQKAEVTRKLRASGAHG